MQAQKLMLAASVSFIALTGTAAAVESFEEIVVTATRRAESLQDVSASVSALTNFDLQRQGLDNFEGLARSIPGLTMTQPVKNRAVFNIRGIATTVTGSNTQDPVSVYVNDTPVTDTYGAIVQPDLRLFDIERVEVLRGPQGTLFGSGSLGGTVRIITNKPRADATEVAGRIDLGVSDGGAFRQRYDLMLNTPIIEDKLALRFVGYYRDEEGWVENVNLGTRNDTVDWGGRLAAQWTPNSDLTVRLEIIHQESDPEDGDGWNPAIGKFKSSSAIPLPRPSNLTNYSLTVDYGVDGFADLTSISTYQRSVSASLGDAGDAFGVGLPLLSLSDPWASKFYTQEFRIVSNTDSRFDWLFGAFFVDRETNVDFLLQVPGLRDWSGGTIPTDDYFVSRITTKSQELAGYGDFGYRFLDNWRISAGLRVFRTKVSYEEPDRRVLNFSTFEIDRSSLLNKGKDSDWTWRTALSYEPSEDAMLYGGVSKGYRIGQVNPNRGPSPIDPSDVIIPESYEPDETFNYEIGAKTSWFDGRLVANLALFWIDWKNIQIDASRLSDRRNFVANAGKATSKGIELSVDARPVEGLDIGGSVTLQDSEIKSIDLADSLRSGAVKGDTLPGAVDVKFAANIQYSWQAFTDKQAYVRVDGQYVDSSPNTFSRQAGTGNPNPFFTMNESYENINAAIGLVAERWEFAIYGENLTNNDAWILNDGGQSANPIVTLRPLTVGARFSFRY